MNAPPPWKKGPAARLKALLAHSDLTAAEVGRRLGNVSRHTISAYLNGRNAPNADRLAAIVAMCPGGSIDDLFDLRPSPDLARAFRAEVAEHGPAVACERASRLVLELVGRPPGKPTRAR